MLVSEGGGRGATVPAGVVAGWRFADIVVDTRLAQVWRQGHAVSLDRSGFLLLAHLAANAGDVVAKDALLHAGWPGRVVSENSLAKSIGKLRLALGDVDAALIRSVHGYGYRLSVAVEPITTQTLALATASPTPVRRMSHRGWRLGIAILVASALIGVAWFSLRERVPALQPSASRALPTSNPAMAVEDTIAVLPFRDASPNASLGLLADGFATHLRDQLQRVPALRIVDRSDSQAVARRLVDPAAIADELGANLVVTGEISHPGDMLRVELQLHDTRGRIPGWSRSFERRPYDQATLLEDLTAALYAGLGDQPERWAYDPARGRGTANHDAYLTFLRAATLFGGNNDPNSQRRTIAVLEQAIELDPNYADAWFMLGGILGGSGYYADSPAELVAGRVRGIAAMERGLALAPEHPDRYLERSEMRLLYHFDWDGARADLDAAAARTPGGESARLLVWKARFVASAGRIDEAIALGARAIALDPESGARRNQGWHYLARRDTRNARAVLMLQLKDLPENPHTNFYLALCDIFEGQPDAALRRLELSSTLFRLVGTAIAQHELGDRAASDLALQKLKDQFAIADGYWAGAVHAWRGESDEAFHWLERALAGGDSSVMYLPFDPLLENLRSDARYAAALAILKLPDADADAAGR
jgi:DNA-binding winged helix-turn-helix (wHTH) protein/TolB-like protein